MPVKKIKEEDIKLEDALLRLDEVVKALDSENIDLDASLKLYEEGVRLVRICNERLSDAERRIKMLKVGADGEVLEVDFDNGGDGTND